VCRGLAAAGARVAVAGHNQEKADGCAAEVRKDGGDAEPFTFDALSATETRQMVDAVAAKWGRLDILVNTVGGNQRAELADEVTEDGFEHVMKLNLTSAMFQSQASARHMIAGGRGGKQVHIGSVRSLLALRGKGFSAYCAAKGGLSILCKQLAAEWAPHNITVNMVSPTFVRTPQGERFLTDPAFYQSVVGRIPLGRIGEPDDVANAVLFFVSPASDFITGQTLYLDGGITATQ